MVIGLLARDLASAEYSTRWLFQKICKLDLYLQTLICKRKTLFKMISYSIITNMKIFILIDEWWLNNKAGVYILSSNLISSLPLSILFSTVISEISSFFAEFSLFDTANPLLGIFYVSGVYGEGARFWLFWPSDATRRNATMRWEGMKRCT